MQSPTDAWREYRIRRNLSLVAFFGYVPCIAAAAVVAKRLWGSVEPALVVALAWMIFALIVGNWFLGFRCPRCGGAFFAVSQRRLFKTMVRRCASCGLPLNGPLADSASPQNQV